MKRFIDNVPASNVVHSEVQRFGQPWMWILLLIPTVIVWVGAFYQLVLGKPFGNHPASNALLLCLLGGFGVLLPILFASLKLITFVTSEGIAVRFYPLHRKFRFYGPEEIAFYESVTYRPIRDYGGWGIRCGKNSWAYNVRGNRGVMLHLKEGKDLLIGSQDPERIVEALSQVIPLEDHSDGEKE